MILRWILALILLPLLLVYLMLSNVFQMCTLLVLPFSGTAFRRLNSRISSAWFRALVETMGALGVKVKVTGDPIPWEENAFLIANHQSMVDIPVLLVLAHQAGRKGHCKWFVKDVLKFLPGIGWGMLFLDCLFVKRNWTADKDKITATFQNLRSHKSPFWVVSFLEGTRSTISKLAKSQEYARKQGLPALTHVMVPRTKGFEATLEGLGDLNRAIYDVTIAYNKPRPKLRHLFFGPIKEITVVFKRYTAWPADNAGRSAWAMQRFQEKDQFLDKFYRERTK